MRAFAEVAGVGDHEPSPLLAMRTHRRGEPSLGAGGRGLPSGRRESGASFPVAQQILRRSNSTGECQHLPGEILQDDRRVDEFGCGLDDLRDFRPAHPQSGEHLVDVPREDDLLVLVGDDGAVHLFGDVHEADRAFEDHHGQLEAISVRRNGIGYVGVEEFRDHSDRSGSREPLQVTGGVPTAEGFAALARRGEGLTSPELATLMGHAKLDVKTELCAGTGAFDDPYFSDRLTRYFPQALADLGDVDDFPLRTEVIATELVNDLFAFGGLTFAFRLREETGAAAADIVRAFVVAVEVMGLAELQSDIEAAGLRPEVEYEIIAEARRLLDRASRWLLTRRPQPIPVTETIERFRIVRDSAPQVSIWLRRDEAARIESAVAQYTEAGVPPAIARRVAEGLYRYSVLDIAEVAEETGCDIATVGAVYFALSDHIDVDRWADPSLGTAPRGSLACAGPLRAAGRPVPRTPRPHLRRRRNPGRRPGPGGRGLLLADRGHRGLGTLQPDGAAEGDGHPGRDRGGRTLRLATLAVAARHIRSVADGR